MGKQKVVQFIHGLNTGGAETLVKEYALHLNKDKYDVYVLCLDHIPTPYDEILNTAGIPVIYIEDKFFIHFKGLLGKVTNKLQSYFFTRKYLRKINPDIVHIHLNLNGIFRFANLNAKTKVFFTVHSEPSKTWLTGDWRDRSDFKEAKKNIKKYGMRFVVLHEKMKKEIDSLFKVDNSVILNNGIDFSRFNIDISSKVAKERLGIPSDAFVVGHIGRFSAVKNHAFLIQAFKELYKQNSKAFLLMVGSGELKERVEAQLKECGLSERCKILENRTDIPQILAAMDVFAFPSFYEGLPITLIEAQKMERPCFVSINVSRAAEISNLITWIDIKNPQEWANKILEYKSKTVEYYGLENWSMNATVKRLEDIYEGRV